VELQKYAPEDFKIGNPSERRHTSKTGRLRCSGIDFFIELRWITI
jgi:hypothetical protein